MTVVSNNSSADYAHAGPHLHPVSSWDNVSTGGNNLVDTPNTNTGYLTGDNSSALNAGRTIRGSGTFDQGAPRTAEFQLKLNF